MNFYCKYFFPFLLLPEIVYFFFSITKEFIHGILRIPVGKTQIWETPKECLGEEKELGAYKRKSHKVVKSCLVIK